MEIADKVVVVTGGASGIGKAVCEKFAAAGAKKVVVVDLNAEGAAAVAESIGGWSKAVNVANEQEIVALINEVEDQFGPIDLFFSNAGIGGPADLQASNEHWENIWQINTMSHVYAARHLVPKMVARGGGYLVSTSSAAGLLSQINSLTYAVTKHAAVSVAEWISITHGHEGIKVSVLCPQAVRTAMTAGGAGVAAVDGMIEAEEVADCVVAAIREEQFLILPHPEVAEYIKRKTSNYDRWLHGMRRLQEKFGTSG